MSGTPLHRAVDQSARDRIRDDLDTNFLVEAGAGSGKTTCAHWQDAVAHPLGRIRSSGLPRSPSPARRPQNCARSSSSSSSRKARRDSPERKQRSEIALANLDAGFIGTIHAFCGRLLRDRALEAGRGPDLRGGR